MRFTRLKVRSTDAEACSLALAPATISVRPGRGLTKQACLSSLFVMKARVTTVGAFEAKNTFSELLEQVGRGAEITITKHDRPVARLVPAVAPGQKERRKAAAELRVLRERYSLKGLSVRELIDAGRK